MQSRSKGEYHANNQTMAKLLHKAIGLGDGSKVRPPTRSTLNPPSLLPRTATPTATSTTATRRSPLLSFPSRPRRLSLSPPAPAANPNRKP